jgi:hypothetical protein
VKKKSPHLTTEQFNEEDLGRLAMSIAHMDKIGDPLSVANVNIKDLMHASLLQWSENPKNQPVVGIVLIDKSDRAVLMLLNVSRRLQLVPLNIAPKSVAMTMVYSPNKSKTHLGIELNGRKYKLSPRSFHLIGILDLPIADIRKGDVWLDFEFDVKSTKSTFIPAMICFIKDLDATLEQLVRPARSHAHKRQIS